MPATIFSQGPAQHGHMRLITALSRCVAGWIYTPNSPPLPERAQRCIGAAALQRAPQGRELTQVNSRRG